MKSLREATSKVVASHAVPSGDVGHMAISRAICRAANGALDCAVYRDVSRAVDVAVYETTDAVRENVPK